MPPGGGENNERPINVADVCPIGLSRRERKTAARAITKRRSSEIRHVCYRPAVIDDARRLGEGQE